MPRNDKRGGERSAAISVLQGRKTKKRDCFVPRNDKRGGERSVAFSPESCRREHFLSSRAKRGDLACPALANREKRDCFVGNSVIASAAWRSRLSPVVVSTSCHRERSVAISVLQGRQTKRRDCFAGSQ